MNRNSNSGSKHVFLWLAIPFLAAFVITGTAAPAGPAPPVTPADTLVLHGKVYTQQPAKPWAEAVAISGDKIVAVGADKDLEQYRGPKTRTIDAAGRVVLPGFTDCHIHVLDGSFSLDEPDLNGARTIPEIQMRLKDFAFAHPEKPWIIGQGWTYDAVGPSGLPDKKDLDAIIPDRPVYLDSYDGHSAWVNSKGLAAANINRDTPDPLAGKIVRDPATGDATGALKESATDLVFKVVPKPTQQEKLTALRAGLALAAQNGLVRVDSLGGDFDDLDLLDSLRQSNELTLRFYVAKVIHPPELLPSDLSALEAARAKYHDDWISAGAAKFFMDGVVESHTAAMLAPYSDAPNLSGTPNWQADQYDHAVTELDRRGIQIFTHAIGDRAVRMALDGYQQAETKNGAHDARYRIEHIETISPDDIPRFSSQGIIASMQPLHAYPDEDTAVWARNVGPAREKLAFAWNTLSKSGARLAFGSDWPVVTLNPWAGIQCAVTRQTNEGKPAGGWVSEQRITVAQAIDGYTTGAAYAGHREKTEGGLEAGKLADLIIVSQNPFEVDPHELGKTKVVLTMVGGRIVYQSKSGDAAQAAKGAQ